MSSSSSYDSTISENERDQTQSIQLLHAAKGSPRSKIRNFIENITIEPVMLLHMLGSSMTGVILQDLYLERICRVTLENPAEVCLNLVRNIEPNKTLEEEVAAVAGKYGLWKSIVENIFPIMFAIFLGPWSDKHGNKFTLLLPLFGFILSAAFYTLFCFLQDLPPGYLLIASIPISLTGGMVTFVLSALSYISSITTNDSRSSRFAFLEACWFLGAPIGLLSGAAIYKSAGFLPIFMLSATLYTMALLFGVALIKENVPDVPGPSNCFDDMFNIAAVKDTFSVLFVRREFGRRMYLWLLVLALTFRVMTTVSPIVCNFLFTRHQFGWNEQTYSTFVAADGFLGVAGTLCMALVGIKIFQLSDCFVALTSTVGCVAANLIIGFAPANPHFQWMIYLASVTQMFGGMVGIAVRSLISKIVTKQEFNKVFTLVVCVETSVVPFIGGSLFSFLYMSTQREFPGAFSLVNAGMNSFVIIIFTHLFFALRDTQEIVELENEEQIINA